MLKHIMSEWKRRLAARKRKNRKIKLSRSEMFANLAKYVFIGTLLLILLIFVGVPLFARTLPSPENVIRKEGFSTQILDREGNLLYDVFVDERRMPIEITAVPEYLKNATIAIEDKNFYKHQGFDPLGMIRGISRILTRGYAQGGSTLTQQLVKNVLLTPERTIIRKIRELILTIQIENKYSKDQILELYLNEAPYGGTAWGVQSASEIYFGKDATDLNLVESAFLAGLPQSPSRYSPYSSSDKEYIGRTQAVLRRMREDGYINSEQEREAVKQVEELEFQPRGANFKAPHFVQYVQGILEERYGEAVVAQGGLKVTTTLDSNLQDKMQVIVAEEIEKVKGFDISNGASVAIDPETGEILAMVGSRGFNDPEIDGQVNVTLSLRQPGSAIKPITYVTAFKKGYTASTLIMDVPTEFPGGVGQPAYRPVNYDGKYRGPIQLRYALGNSINLPAVKILAMVGISEVLQTAYDLGITSLEPTKETLSRVGLSLTLGGGEVRLLELTAAYGAFMNGGFRVEPVSILKVEDRDGKVLEVVEPKKQKQVLSAEEAFLIADILSDNSARTLIFGANSLLNIPGREVAVKTGTTNDKRDNWTIGGNSQVVVGVWVGNNDNSEMREVASGVTGASPIWRKSILEALSGKPNVSFEVPSGIVTASVDSVSGYREHDGFPARTEYFIKGTEPGEDIVHVKLKICKDGDRLATPPQVVANQYNEREYFVFKEEDPTVPLGGSEPNRWQEGILNWLKDQPDEHYHPPSDFCEGGNLAPINVEFIEPTDRTSDLINEFKIKFRAEAVHTISEVKLEIDGVHTRSFTGLPYEHTVNLADGVHQLRAIVKDSEGNESDRVITVGVGVSWDFIATPAP